MIKAVIFDLDGTLWSTSEQILPAWNDVLRRKNLPLITVEQMNSFMGKTPDMIASMMLPYIPHEEAMRPEIAQRHIVRTVSNLINNKLLRPIVNSDK